MKRFLVSGSLLVSVVISGCAASISSDQSSKILEASQRDGPVYDADLTRRSTAAHAFISGQISFNEENFQDALTHFSQASTLIEGDAPFLHTRLAELYVRAGEMDRALEEVRKAVAQDSSDVSGRLLLAGILESQGDGAEAEREYATLLRDHPSLVQPYVLLAGLYLRSERASLAVSTLKKLIAVSPQESVAHYYLGRAYEISLDLANAEASLRLAYEKDEENEEIATDLLRVILKRKRVDEAKKLATAMLARDPKSTVARRVMGQLMLSENKLDLALEHLEALEVVEDDPTETRFKMAVIHINRQNFSDAIRDLSLVLARKPDHDTARYYLASIYAGGGRRRDAVKELLMIRPEQEMFVKSRTFAAFLLRQEGLLDAAASAVREALDAEQGNVSVLSYLVLILRQAGKFDEAEDVLRDALDDDPTNEKLLVNYALILSDLRRTSESVRWMERVIEINPKNADALNFVAYSLAERGAELDRAEALAQRALEERPNDGYILDTLGWVYFKRGDVERAEMTLGRAVGLVVGDIVISEHYAEVLAAIGKEAQALDVLKGAIEKFSASDARRDEIDSFERVKSKLRALEKRRSAQSK